MPTDINQLKIVTYPAKVLRKKAKAIALIDDEHRAIAQKMLQLMHQAPGVGLAAPQVGLSIRMFVANDTGEPHDDRVFINPVLVDPSRELAERDEGCLSIPKVTVNIRRPKTITIRALNELGQPVEYTSSDLAARIWQHETDHLDGILIIDRMSEEDRLANRRQLRELEAS